MKENKDINVSNGMFELKIHWNGGIISTQAALLLGIGALYVCSNSSAIHSLCGLALMIDAICIVFYLINTSKKDSDNDGEEVKEDAGSTEAPDTEVEHKKGKKKSVSSSTKTIKKKVPVPNPSATRTHGSATPAQAAPSAVEPEPMPIPQAAPAPEPATTPEQEEQIEEDWGGFF